MWRSASPVSRSAGTLSIALSYRILQEKVDILDSVLVKGWAHKSRHLRMIFWHFYDSHVLYTVDYFKKIFFYSFCSWVPVLRPRIFIYVQYNIWQDAGIRTRVAATAARFAATANSYY